MKRKWTLLILVIGVIAAVRSAPPSSSASSLEDVSSAETYMLPRLSIESASKTVNTSNDTLLPLTNSNQITAVESGLNDSVNATLPKDTVNLTSSNVENVQVNSTSESRASGISEQKTLNSESNVKFTETAAQGGISVGDLATQEGGPVGDPAPEGGSPVDDTVTQEKGPVGDPQGGSPTGDPALQGGSPAGDLAPQGGSPADDPAPQGGSPTGDPAPQEGSQANDPTNQGGSVGVNPALREGSPVVDPGTQGGSLVDDPATRGGSPVANTAPQEGSPVIDPATQGGSPVDDPATQGGSPVANAVPQEGSPVANTAPQEGSPVANTAPQEGSPVIDSASQGGSPVVDPATQGGSAVDDSTAVEANQEGGSDDGNTDNDGDYIPRPVQEIKSSPVPAFPDDTKDETGIDKNNPNLPLDQDLYSDVTKESSIPSKGVAQQPLDDSLPYGYDGNEFGSQSSMSNSGSAYSESYGTDPEEESDGSLKREDEGNSFASHNQEGQLTDDKDSHFFAYFLTIMVTAIIFYLVFHNKQRIIALIIEGRAPRNGRSRRASSKAKYHKLDNNLEEAITATKGAKRL